MAEITAFKELIENSSRGETVRDAFTGALKTMDRDGISAETLNGYSANNFVKLKEFNNALINNKFKNVEIYEKTLNRTSTKGVESNSIYWIYKRLADQLDHLLGDS